MVFKKLLPTELDPIKQELVFLGLRRQKGSGAAVAVGETEQDRLRHSFAAVVAIGGAVFMRARKPEAAFAEFQEAHGIYQSLRDANVGYAFHAACTAESTEKMAEASARAGNAQAARDYFQKALAFAEPLISAGSSDSNVLYVAADAYSGLGDIALKRAAQPGQTTAGRKAGWAEARSLYVKSLAAWRRIEHPNRSASGFEVGEPNTVEKNLQQCDVALSPVHQTPGEYHEFKTPSHTKERLQSASSRGMPTS